MTSILSGRAEPESTRQHGERAGIHPRRLGRSNLWVSPVGFGGYRVHVDSVLHRRALADALAAGVNVIDTSTNYTDGHSERLVGEVLGDRIASGVIDREAVVVVSKVGYLQGSNLERARSRAYPDVVRLRDDLWHCIEPGFIRDQLQASLGRLRLQHLDVLLLHNPEYALLHAAEEGIARPEALQRYESRLRRAFEALEELVHAGHIGGYGMSSNGFVEPPTEVTRNGLHRAIGLAHDVAGAGHHFSVAQMPANLFELGAATELWPTGDGPRSSLAVADAANVGVLLNRPLNAFVERRGGRRLLRLASPPQEVVSAGGGAAASLARVRKLEARWATGLGKILRTAEGSDAVDLFRWGQELSARLGEIGSPQRWAALRHEVIAPHLGQTSAALLASLHGEQRREFAEFWTEYGTALHDAFVAIEGDLHRRDQSTVDAVMAGLAPHLPEPWRSRPLSQQAVLTLMSLPVASVLVGMRQPSYVRDMVELPTEPATVDIGRVAASMAQVAKALHPPEPDPA